MVVLFLVFWEASVLFSSVAALIRTLTDNLQGFLLLQFLTNVCYLFSFLMIGCFHVLAIANSAAVNVRVHVSFHISVFIFLNCIPRSRIAGLYGSSIFSFSLSFFKPNSRHSPVLQIFSIIKYSFIQSCLNLCDPMDCSLPDSSAHGISQARILERVAISSPGHLLHPGIEPGSPAPASRFFTNEPPGKCINTQFQTSKSTSVKNSL